MKSWISFLLPDDEYREKRMLYFLAEGAVILLLYVIGVFIVHRYIPVIPIDLEFALFIAIWLFVGYVFLRYVISGMEHTDITTKTEYKQQLKVITVKSVGFVVIFNLAYLLFITPSTLGEWGELVAVSIVGGIILFTLDYTSLAKSYKKNKELV
jgi:hypothetical protein